MGTVRRGKSIVDVIVAERRHAFGELRVVLLLTGVETGVLEDADIAREHRRDRAFGFRPLAILNKPNRAAGQLPQRLDQQRRRHVRPVLALRTPEVRQQQDDSTSIRQLGNRRHHRPQARVVAHRAVQHRYIQIDANEDALSGQVFRQIVEGLESAHELARMFTMFTLTSARPWRFPMIDALINAAIFRLGACRTALSRAWPLPWRCRPCGSRSPIRCHTS